MRENGLCLNNETIIGSHFAVCCEEQNGGNVAIGINREARKFPNNE